MNDDDGFEPYQITLRCTVCQKDIGGFKVPKNATGDYLKSLYIVIRNAHAEREIGKGADVILEALEAGAEREHEETADHWGKAACGEAELCIFCQAIAEHKKALA